MLQINISQQPTKLEYTTQDAQLNLQSTPTQVEMESPPASLEIHQPQGQLVIDQTSCRYSRGFKNIQEFASDNAQAGMQAAMEATGRIAEEGDRLARIESKENAIANIAAESNVSDQSEITWAPINLPSIQFQVNPLEINGTPRKVNFTIQPGKLQGQYQPGSVDIQVSQYPSIEITAVDVKG